MQVEKRNLQRFFSTLFLLLLVPVAWSQRAADSFRPWDAKHDSNPILPGYFADPSLVQFNGKYYLYATLDPWGGETLGAWESPDLKDWTYKTLNWPTKHAATSPTSKEAMAWAPSVIRAKDGRFYMYVSVGSEVWVGVADQPLGPWKNALGDKPLIPSTWNTKYHMIDAEAFLDEDGSAYLYWGSGWNWTNGHCFVVKLKADMITFDGEPKDVTPEHYFEGPFMFRWKDRYYLMSSYGKTTTDTYQVRYAVGSSPLGPFHEPVDEPILATDKEHQILSPGHHAVFVYKGEPYILYHRQSIPFDPKEIHRQVCIDKLVFLENGNIAKVTPTHAGPAFLRTGSRMGRNIADSVNNVIVTASSSAGPVYNPSRVIDDNYATKWKPSAAEDKSWIQLDLGQERGIEAVSLRMEYPWKTYHFLLQGSSDGQQWKMFEDASTAGSSGSPIFLHRPQRCRYLRLTFPKPQADEPVAIFEWQVLQ